MLPNATLRIELFGSLRVFLGGTQVPIKSQRLGSLLGRWRCRGPSQGPYLLRSSGPRGLAGRNSSGSQLHGLRQTLEPTQQDRGSVLSEASRPPLP